MQAETEMQSRDEPGAKDDGSGAAAAGNILDSISARDRRSIAIRFLRSDESMGALLIRCRGDSPSARESRAVLACVLLMAKEDAPKDLVMTDAGLYEVLRKRITEIRLGGWVK
jgi:hypothetical protein